MTSPPIDGVLLDHVAHAVPRWQDVWDRYAVDLGAVWHSGGPGPGFAPAQLRFANEARVEVLMPWDTGVNDFLDRFLVANGPGPHHLTFKVPDLRSALATAEAAGFTPIGVDLRFPEWMEAFLHPKEASGVVVQLAQAEEGMPPGEPPEDYPTGRRSGPDGAPLPPASLLRVVHVQRDLAVARRVFGDLLGGRRTAEWAQDGFRWLDLTWGGPLDLRLVGPDEDDPESGAVTAVARWAGTRQGRVHHLELAGEDAAAVSGAVACDAALPWWGGPRGTRPTAWVPPEHNLGLGLALLPPDGSRSGGK
jgi:methylmalonyl-CoA/ethylmalonyl-CoA epimerase